jgi:hypothetical protein
VLYFLAHQATYVYVIPMKYSMFVLFFLLGATAEAGCSNSPLVGIWPDDYGNFMSLYPNCTAYSNYCNTRFTYTNVTALSGEVIIDIISNDGGSHCATLGKHVCSYIKSGTTLSMTCN